DYLLLKEFSQRAGLSMAEALHKFITGKPKPEPEPEPVAARLASKVTAPVPATRSTPVPTASSVSVPVTAITTNGNKIVAFRIKSKGVRYD
ncbi:unnamed protein product, partial [marine sediment metagenome]